MLIHNETPGAMKRLLPSSSCRESAVIFSGMIRCIGPSAHLGTNASDRDTLCANKIYAGLNHDQANFNDLGINEQIGSVRCKGRR